MADTIFAQATAPGKAGVAIVRVSGDRALEGCRSLVGSVPPPHRAALRRVVDEGRHLDDAVILHFPRGRSFTGEDVVEFQLHGSIAICRAVLDALSRLPGFRPAEAGEFTRRALENEALDLAQVEGLSDLIDAETEAQRLQAQRVFSGELGRRAAAWRRTLIEAAALIEATIDFADEDLPVDVTPDVTQRLTRVAADLDRDLSTTGAAERIRNGFEVAIVGPPNAGKSTLLNALARRKAALTSEIAGTTRDVIEVRMDLGGFPVTLLDTAGLRETSDRLEQAGIDLARERAAAADLRLHVLAPDGAALSDDGPIDLYVRTHSDIAPSHDRAVSGTTGQGLTPLVDRIVDRLKRLVPTDTVVIRARHAAAIQASRRTLGEAMTLLEGAAPSELVAETITLAAADLMPLIGRIDAEDLLEDIFSRFCIGK